MPDCIARLVGELLDARRAGGQLDIVDDLAYPLPVTVICELLGVPREDEPRFHAWATPLAHSLDPAQGMSEEQVGHVAQAAAQMGAYLGELIAARRAQPADDLLSGLGTDPDPAWRMDGPELLGTMILLLVAGHETTVNLITKGMLTLLRHPDALARLRREPDLVIPLVEEVLRYYPPVQFRTRTTLTDLDVAGVTIQAVSDVLRCIVGPLHEGTRVVRRGRIVRDMVHLPRGPTLPPSCEPPDHLLIRHVQPVHPGGGGALRVRGQHTGCAGGSVCHLADAQLRGAVS